MITDLHDFIADTKAAEEANGNGAATRVYHLRMTDKIKPGGALIWLAALLLLALAAAQGFVSWRAQYGFIFAAKHDHTASGLQALGLDTGAVIFALLGLALARMGRSAVIERTLNIACALGSAAMNVLAADLGSPRSIVVYTMPAVLYTACSDRLIATAGRAAGIGETSQWRWIGRCPVRAARHACPAVHVLWPAPQAARRYPAAGEAPAGWTGTVGTPRQRCSCAGSPGGPGRKTCAGQGHPTSTSGAPWR
jgi:hypothetical protein